MSHTPDLWALVLAAGQSSRLKAQGVHTPKQFLPHGDLPLYLRSALTLAAEPRVGGLVFVFAESDFLDQQSFLLDFFQEHGEPVPWLAAVGGARRQDSVRQGLAALPPVCTHVLVHDAARPFASAELIGRVVQALDSGAAAVIPAVAVKDTVKRLSGDLVAETLPRDELCAVQTPQGFVLASLLQAHEAAEAQGLDVTDDAAMIEALGLPVTVVAGEEANRKITTAQDLELLKSSEQTSTPPPPQDVPATGFGYDVHRYVPLDAEKARPLKLGGVPIKGKYAVAAHSDGDVLLHALTDALLGLTGQGDIGDRFPDTDPALDGLESGVFVNEVLQDLRAQGVTLTHVDTTIVAQVPKIAPHKEIIRGQLASLLGLAPSQVNVKATTEEGLGFTGEKKGIKAMALVTAIKPKR